MSENLKGTSKLIEVNEYLRVNFENLVSKMSDKMSDAEIATELDIDQETVRNLKRQQSSR